MKPRAGLSHELVSQLAHELRSPLGAILGWAHLLRRRGGDPETMRGLEVIEQSVQAQTRLIDNLVDLSRLAGGTLALDFRAVEPRSIVDAAVEALALDAGHRSIRFAKILDLGVPPVLGDAGRLKQVLVSLLCNALRDTPDDGAIEVALRRADAQAEITVTDTGRGLTPPELEHLFDAPGDHGSASRPLGLSVGLAVARRVMELHGGSLLAASEGEGRGATYSMRLPLA